MHESAQPVYGREARNRKRMILYALPVLLTGGLLLTYVLSPGFYLEYMLQETRRELQLVEIATFFSAFAGGVLILASAWRHLRALARDYSLGGPMGAAGIMAAIGLAALFFAGEEINYGQTWFGSDIEGDLEHVSNDFNLHNHFEWFSIQGLGSLFLICMFLLLPLAWNFRRRLGLPEAWKPAVAEGPVVFIIFIAFAWKEVKNLYRLLIDVGEPPEPRFYWEFLEQINEQKEMLIAVGLLMYGLFRLRAIRKPGGFSPAES